MLFRAIECYLFTGGCRPTGWKPALNEFSSVEAMDVSPDQESSGLRRDLGGAARPAAPARTIPGRPARRNCGSRTEPGPHSGPPDAARHQAEHRHAELLAVR